MPVELKKYSIGKLKAFSLQVGKLISLILILVSFFLDINECQPDPCVNGTCIDQINGYNCTCNAGYTGRNCSTSI